MKHADALAALDNLGAERRRAVLAALPAELRPPSTDVYTVGFECELANWPADLVQKLCEYGLTNTGHQHAYHCHCELTCGPRAGIDIKPQADSSCAGELVSRVLHWPTTEAASVLERLSRALIDTGTNASGVTAMNGFHVHVGKPTGWDEEDIASLLSIFAAYQFEVSQLATQWRPRVRRYNHPINSEALASMMADPHRANLMIQKGAWLSDRGQTYEFRMWNGVQAAWRMRMNIGVSVAFMRAARANHGWRCSETVTRPLSTLVAEQGSYARAETALPMPKRGQHFLDVVGPHMDDVVLADVIRQLDDRSKVDA